MAATARGNAKVADFLHEENGPQGTNLAIVAPTFLEALRRPTFRKSGQNA